MRFAILASGSKGNAAVVEHGGPAGDDRLRPEFPAAGAGAWSSSAPVPADLTAILVTHEHRDHVVGLAALARHTGLRPHMTRGTAHQLDFLADDFIPLTADGGFELGGGLRVRPYTIPHDAREPVHYQLAAGDAVLSFATDIGRSNDYLVEVLGPSTALVLESNYDPLMLAGNPSYPASLKNRIQGGLGHLSNDEAAALLAQINGPALLTVVAAHLSDNNNRPDLPLGLLQASAGRTGHMPQISVCPQGVLQPWIELPA